MLHELSIEMRFVLCSLATWRLTHLFVAEDGPWDIIVRLRAKLGQSMAGRMMDCFHCLSAWIAIPFAFVLTHDTLTWMVCWLAISGTASLLEQATGRQSHSSPPPEQGDQQ
jgi:hypothetical protein